MHHSFGRRVVMPLPTSYMLLYTHNAVIITGRASREQSTAAVKVPTTSLQKMTPKQQEIFILNNDLIFTNLRANHIDYRLAVVYARLKTGYIEHVLVIYKNLAKHYPDQKERFTDVNIYNAFIEAYMKRGGESIWEALSWLDEMRRQEIKPNLTTYVILIKGFLRFGPIDVAHALLIEMLKEGYSISAFMFNRNISNDDLKMLNLMCKAKGGIILRFHQHKSTSY
jgi:pentatricopeptide repeat protein